MGGIDEPLDQARTAVDKVADGMDVGLTALSREGEVVFSSIEEAIRKLDFRSDLGDVLDDCLRIAAETGCGRRPAIAAGNEAIDRFSAKIFKTYTMAQERVIHERFLPVIGAPVAEAWPADDDER